MTVLSNLKKFLHNTKKHPQKNKSKKHHNCKANSKKATTYSLPTDASPKQKGKKQKLTILKSARMLGQTTTLTPIPAIPKEITSRKSPKKFSQTKKAIKKSSLKIKKENSVSDGVDIKLSKADNKTVFLHFVSNCDNLNQAVKKSGIPPSAIHFLLKTDNAFCKEVDEVLNKKLEFAAIDTALGGNSSLLILMLTNRMSNKYKSKPASEDAPQNSRIIFIDSDKISKGKK
ncbi:MAG TPA: hypothetical protein VMW66_04900 [Elusimicrobiales bacterium]|nr:hypothetical protein [Elusimicrobiales bacterium]